ncbi:hypothetical protein NL676_034184 [Syzygium grande]|nr:hypothetical protein NL676_034184 [Syzygium grande]
MTMSVFCDRIARARPAVAGDLLPSHRPSRRKTRPPLSRLSSCAARELIATFSPPESTRPAGVSSTSALAPSPSPPPSANSPPASLFPKPPPYSITPSRTPARRQSA